MSGNDYFGKLVDIILSDKQDTFEFVKFINNYDINFDFYKSKYDINLIYKNYEHKIKNETENIKNYNLGLFYDDNESILRIYYKILMKEQFEIGRFFSSIIMSARGKKPKDKENIEKIKVKILSSRIVASWIQQNQSILYKQIFNNCH